METLARAANRGSVSTGYDIDNSLKLEIDNTEYITRTNASAGNSKTFTFSGWYKFTELFSGDGPSLFEIYGTGPLKYFSIYMYQYTLIFYDYLGGVDYGKQTTQVFRDTSAWYHIVLSVDTTDATAADRMKLYINGTRVTAFNTDFGDPPQNFDTQANKSSMANRIGYSAALSGIYYSGYVSEVNFVDGQALAPTDFGEFDADTGIWKPIETNISSYGTNGFQLKFDNASDLGEDASGGSSFTLNNITSADQATDTPTNNFCIQSSVIDFRQRQPVTTFAVNGGTSSSDTSSNSWRGVMCTMGVTSGKWYWEVKYNDVDDQRAGVHTFTGDVGSNTNPQAIDNFWGLYGGDGSGCYWTSQIDGVGTSNSANRGNVIGGGSIIGVALNLDDDELSFYINGSSGGANVSNIDISTLTAAGNPLIPMINLYRNTMQTNFGGFSGFTISTGNTDENGYGNFEYAPPSGYYALCSKNLAEFG